jgi:hypothetical protein
VLSGLSAGRRGDSAMARTYREIAIEEMLRIVQEAMSQVIDRFGIGTGTVQRISIRGDFCFGDFTHAPSPENLPKNGFCPLKGGSLSDGNRF